MLYKGLLRIALLLVAVLLCQGTWVLAGTTGNIQGKVTDQNGNGISGAHVTVASPSQRQTITAGSNGFYAALDLSPDTYAVTASANGFDTATVYGITVQADQTSRADVQLHPATKVLGHVVTTATATVVSRTVTGDLYAVNSQAINAYQGSQGGSETLYSQNGVVASLPGVVRMVGSGGGYGGQGQLSLRGGAMDQVGYELEGVELNRGFDFYNGTNFLTNGLASLEVYTGGAPASEGRAMSGYVNEVINRGRYPGGAEFTGVVGSPIFNHTINANVFGGTPDDRFTYYLSTLATNSYYNFGDRSNEAGFSFTVPANDPGCPAFNALTPPVTGTAGGPALNCAVSNTIYTPVSLGAYGSNPFALLRDSVANLHWALPHNGGLNDDLQALYNVGYGLQAPYGMYGTPFADNGSGVQYGFGPFSSVPGQNLWPVGFFYQGSVGQPYDPSKLLTLTWPSSGGSFNPATGTGGVIPANFNDSQFQQYSIEKLGYTRAITQSSFLRLYGYQMYSFWTLDQPINGFIGATFYQLHDNATGISMDYENQISSQHLLKIEGDYTRDITQRYNYAPSSGPPTCVGGVPCTPGAAVVSIGGPFSTFNNIVPLDFDGVISDQWKPTDNLLFDLGVRWDSFGFQLMPMVINGPNGIAFLGEETQGKCLDGFNYSPSDPAIIGPGGNQNCFQILSANPDPRFHPGAMNWQDAPGFLSYRDISPRFGATITIDPRNVVRFSVGRYVQPPNSAFEQYRRNPIWGPGTTIGLLNNFYLGLGFGVIHDIKPEDSTNYDLSYEHEFNGGTSFKITPYYRNTRNQILNIPFNPASPSFVTGDNFGTARIKGAEFLLRKNVTGSSGIGATLGVTYTDSKIRFQRVNGTSYIDLLNGRKADGSCAGSGICGYNAAHGTSFAELDPNGYYSPSFVQAPTSTGPSYDVKWVINLSVDAREAGFDLVPTFNYQSGNPYGDPLNFIDPSGLSANGPDPYTKTFDAPGSLIGPSWWSLNLALSHDLGKNIKGTVLATNLVSGVHNHGYPWEYPTSQNVISYGDNSFYLAAPLGAFASVNPNPIWGYYGSNYYPYAPFGILPLRTYEFMVNTKI